MREQTHRARRDRRAVCDHLEPHILSCRMCCIRTVDWWQPPWTGVGAGGAGNRAAQGGGAGLLCLPAANRGHNGRRDRRAPAGVPAEAGDLLARLSEAKSAPPPIVCDRVAHARHIMPYTHNRSATGDHEFALTSLADAVDRSNSLILPLVTKVRGCFYSLLNLVWSAGFTKNLDERHRFLPSKFLLPNR
jgi:hypothetical protein